MQKAVPTSMQAVAIDQFGGEEVLRVRTIAVPEIAADEVLVRVEWAGVGEWDPFEREGGYARMLGMDVSFPYVLGSEGAGTVAAVGEHVHHLAPGDRVFAIGFLNPKGGFYAEYAAVPAALVAEVPRHLGAREASVLGGAGITALRGLEDALKLRAGESVLIFGASGGIGHVAVQLARGMGARVLAAASGADGVEAVRRLGADLVVDGRSGDVAEAARRFAPEGLDAALFTAGGDAAVRALTALRRGGRVTYPNGVHPEMDAPAGVVLSSYNGDPDGEILGRLHRAAASIPIEVLVARTFTMDEAADAHRLLGRHHVGKLVLQVGTSSGS